MQRSAQPGEWGMCLTGGGWSRVGLPEGFSRCSVCVIYPFWKIQTYKSACCKSKGRRGTQVPNKANCIPLTFPGGFLNSNLCGFQPKHIKGMDFCWGSVGVISLSLLRPQQASRRTLGEQDLGKNGLLSAPGISEPDITVLLLK